MFIFYYFYEFIQPTYRPRTRAQTAAQEACNNNDVNQVTSQLQSFAVDNDNDSEIEVVDNNSEIEAVDSNSEIEAVDNYQNYICDSEMEAVMKSIYDKAIDYNKGTNILYSDWRHYCYERIWPKYISKNIKKAWQLGLFEKDATKPLHMSMLNSQNDLEIVAKCINSQKCIGKCSSTLCYDLPFRWSHVAHVWSFWSPVSAVVQPHWYVYLLVLPADPSCTFSILL